MKINEIVNKRTIVLASVGAVLIGGASVFAVQSNQPVNNASNVPVVAEAAPKKEVKVEEVEQVAIVEQEQVVEAPVATIHQTQAPVEEAPTQPQITYKWAAEMAEAGVPESDYGYITDMVLNEHGWREYRHDPSAKIWRRHEHCNPRAEGLVNCIKYAVGWCNVNHGSIKAAYDQWTGVRNDF